MSNIKISGLYATIAIIMLGVALSSFISLSDLLYIAIATPLVTFPPFFSALAVSNAESSRKTINFKILSAVMAFLIFLTGVILAFVHAGPVWFVILNSILLMTWLALAAPFFK